ncbi:MAG: hypothetical protein K2X94_03830, partial [Amoebophilaceae bacterium]|nr:hypothetical protein [Amoebophilaceae bacterium]
MTSKQLSITYRAIFIFYFSLTSSCLEHGSSTSQTANATAHPTDPLPGVALQTQPITTAPDNIVIVSQDAPEMMHQPDQIPAI